MSAQLIASLVLVGAAAISTLVASRALRRVSELKEHIAALEEQLELKRKWDRIQAKNREDANARIDEIHAGDAVGNALGVLSKPNG